jgi:hypothetical protein
MISQHISAQKHCGIQTAEKATVSGEKRIYITCMLEFQEHGAAALLQKRTDIIRWQDNICLSELVVAMR